LSESATQLFLQTVPVLLACIVYLVKQVIEAYKMAMGLSDRRMIEDLWRWHKPQTDPVTGQPIFHWYEDSKTLKLSITELEQAMVELKDELSELRKAYHEAKGHET